MYTFYNTPRLLIELDKAVVLWSDWLVVCDCGFSLSALWCPLSAPTFLLGFLLPSTWGISSWLLQQSTAAAPYLGRGVAPLCRSTPAPSQPTLLSWCFWTVVLEKTLESPLDCKEIQPVHPKGDQSWVFIGRTDAEAETPVLWPPDANSWLILKDHDAGKDWGQEKGMTEDEIIGWHHQLNGHGFGRTPGVGDGQGGLACCGSPGLKEMETTERLNWTSY